MMGWVGVNIFPPSSPTTAPLPHHMQTLPPSRHTQHTTHAARTVKADVARNVHVVRRVHREAAPVGAVKGAVFDVRARRVADEVEVQGVPARLVARAPALERGAGDAHAGGEARRVRPLGGGRAVAVAREEDAPRQEPHLGAVLCAVVGERRRLHDVDGAPAVGERRDGQDLVLIHFGVLPVRGDQDDLVAGRPPHGVAQAQRARARRRGFGEAGPRRAEDGAVDVKRAARLEHVDAVGRVAAGHRDYDLGRERAALGADDERAGGADAADGQRERLVGDDELLCFARV